MYCHLVGPAQLPDLLLVLLDPPSLGRRHPRPGPAVDLVLLDPRPHRLHPDGELVSPPASRSNFPALASTTADPSGPFTLRSPYDDRSRAGESQDGMIQVLVVVTTDGGLSVATDSSDSTPLRSERST